MTTSADKAVETIVRECLQFNWVRNSSNEYEQRIKEAVQALNAHYKQQMLDVVGKNVYDTRPSGGSNAWKAQDNLRNELRKKINDLYKEVE